MRGQPCPALPAAGPHHGQRRLQAQLQEGGDPAHHQDPGEGAAISGGGRGGQRHLGSRRPEGPLTPGPARGTPGAPVRGPRAGPCVWGRGWRCWGPAGPGLRSRPALVRLSQRGRATVSPAWGGTSAGPRGSRQTWPGPVTASGDILCLAEQRLVLTEQTLLS